MNTMASNSESIMSKVLDLIEALPCADVPVEVIQKLAQLPRTEMLASLKGLTHSEDRELSDRAMYAILELDPNYGRTVLLELWNDPTWECFFCYAVLDYGDDAFVSPLCEILRNSQNSNTHYMAAVALEWHGNSTAIQALTFALKDVGGDYEGRKISRKVSEALNAIRKRASSTNQSNS